VRKTRTRKEPSFAAAEFDDDVPSSPRIGRKDLIAAAGLVLIATAITTNALFLQKGPHPAPIFANRAPHPATIEPAIQPAIAPAPMAVPVAVPRPRPAEPAAERIESPAPVRSQTDIVIDIQKELARRGFYDGVADGVYGPKTDAAVRDFEQASGLKPAGDPSETLLRAISRAPLGKIPVRPAADVPRPPDPIGEMLAPAKRVTAVQRALADYGYGQIKPTGILDQDTQHAIEQFERARRMPISGQISPRLMRELAAMTGRPLE
jgi:peptidoglycan hydrolase-like protein with peptidoglycan-binding domain